MESSLRNAEWGASQIRGRRGEWSSSSTMAQQRAFQSVRSALVASRVPSDFELAAVLHRAGRVGSGATLRSVDAVTHVVRCG